MSFESSSPVFFTLLVNVHPVASETTVRLSADRSTTHALTSARASLYDLEGTCVSKGAGNTSSRGRASEQQVLHDCAGVLTDRITTSIEGINSTSVAW